MGTGARWSGFLVCACGCAYLLSFACHLIIPLKSKAGAVTGACRAEVWDCPKVVKASGTDVTVSGPAATKCDPVPGVWSAAKNYEPYCDQGFRLIDPPDALKGAILIPTNLADRDKLNSLTVKLNVDVEGFYVTYDSRVYSPPTWLTSEYVKQPEQLAISMHDETPPPATDKPVKLDVWLRKPGLGGKHKGDVVTVPANTAGNPAWKIAADNRAMYVVFVKPIARVDCSAAGAKRLSPYKLEDCWEGTETAKLVEEARGATLKACQEKNPGSVCQNVCCGKECGAGAADFESACDPSVKSRQYAVGSEIELVPASSPVVVTIDGESHQRPASGRIDFTYDHVKHGMQIDGMTLRLEPPVTAKGVKIEHIAVSLWNTPAAHCQDATFVPKEVPCKTYRIDQGQLSAGAACTIDGEPVVVGLTNSTPIDLEVDQTKKTFHFGKGGQGKMNGVLETSDGPLSVDVAVDLEGLFLNIAPVAKGDESTRFVECSLDRKSGDQTGGQGHLFASNDEPVVLDASGSFDVFDTLPANSATYAWYEDFGLVTERLWKNPSGASGKKVTIPPHRVGLGEHDFTVVVTDNYGIASAAPATVTVTDTRPPEIIVPQDIAVYAPAPAKVNIGKAVAWDACFERVSITNDAPAGLVFPAGVTPVTWKADDSAGHVATAVQHVSVTPLELGKLDAGVLLLSQAASGRMKAIRRCKLERACVIDTASLAAAIEALAKAPPGKEWTPRDRAIALAVREKRGPLTVALREAQSLLQRGERNERERAQLRATAVKKLAAVRDLLVAAGRSGTGRAAAEPRRGATPARAR